MILNLLFSLLFCISAYASNVENLADLNVDKVAVLNDNFKALNDNANKSKNLLNDYFGASGILGTANGGTGQNFSAVAQNAIPYFSATGTMGNIGIGTTGYVLTSQGSSTPPIYLQPTFRLTSATSISAAANTGDIAISNTKYYKVRGTLGALSANDIFWLRFNNSTGAVYNYAFTGYTSAAAAVTGGAEAATKIILGTTVIKPASIATGTTKAQFNFEFNIFPQEIDDTPQVTYTHASGTAEYLDSSSHDNIITFVGKGNPSGGTPITSFRILTAAGSTFYGNVYLYELGTS